MKITLINNHQIQEGDTYGLIYALLMNQAMESQETSSERLYGLYWIKQGEESTDRKVQARLDSFASFGLRDKTKGKRLRRVLCRFNNEVQVIKAGFEQDDIVVSANSSIFNDNPRQVAVFLTGVEQDADFSEVVLSWAALAKVRSEEFMKGLQKEITGLDKRLREMGFPPLIPDQELHEQKDAWIKKNKSILRKLLRDIVNTKKALPTSETDKAAAKKLCKDLIALADAYFAIPFKQQVTEAFSKELNAQLELNFAYISKSTDYLSGCVNGSGVVAVAQTLRERILESTASYTDASQRFIEEFIKGLLQSQQLKMTQRSERHAWKGKPLEAEDKDFVLVLFWIRAARAPERDAIFKTRTSEEEPTLGKPQHHTNMTLYKQVRYQVAELGKQLGKPLLFVPIGDELQELADEKEWFTKQSKKHNLIQFFLREPFKGKPMGAQINFLLQLASRYQVIQVGMRSGSMERLMYLGVPTLYFDRTVKEKDLSPLVGTERIKKLTGFSTGTSKELVDYLVQCRNLIDPHPKENEDKSKAPRGVKGYPLFFQLENRDTGFLKYSLHADSSVTKTVQALTLKFDLEEYNSLKKNMVQKDYLRDHLQTISQAMLKLGGLAEEETKKFMLMLWFISVIYPHYAMRLAGIGTLPRLTFKEDNDYSRQFKSAKHTLKVSEQALREQRKGGNAQEDDEDDGPLFGKDMF